jgi:hypothetical protein
VFSAFSFGKIIKTILPGSILTAGLVLLLEALYGWRSGPEKSLLAMLANEKWLTAFTASLVPLSLILGFLLNTWVWFFFNGAMRREVQRRLKPDVFPKLRQKLSDDLWRKISSYLAEPGKTFDRADYPSRESLEYFYLPVISLQRLNYLWESYFSWYEFQINTAFALLIATPSVIFLAWIKLPDAHGELFLRGAGALAVFVLLLFWWLWVAARENRAEYERDLLLLVAGSLAAVEKKVEAESETC